MVVERSKRSEKEKITGEKHSMFTFFLVWL